MLLAPAISTRTDTLFPYTTLFRSEVIRLANRHPRVNILSPGPGVGGHCIAVDPWFLVSAAPEQTPLIRTAREVNDGKVAHVIDRSEEHTSELQSLMRISYAVFCLKKKKNNKIQIATD